MLAASNILDAVISRTIERNIISCIKCNYHPRFHLTSNYNSFQNPTLTNSLNSEPKIPLSVSRSRIEGKKHSSLLTSSKESQCNTDNNDENFRLVFRFPFIPIITLACRLKIYMTGATCFLTPGVIYMTLNFGIDHQHMYNFIGFCGFSIGTLVLLGEFFRRCVGIVYINSTNSKVKLAHVTFWGKRNDITVPLRDIIPLSETSERVGMLFWKISFYPDSLASNISKRSELIISTRYGGVKDREAFTRIFGEEILLKKFKN